MKQEFKIGETFEVAGIEVTEQDGVYNPEDSINNCIQMMKSCTKDEQSVLIQNVDYVAAVNNALSRMDGVEAKELLNLLSDSVLPDNKIAFFRVF